MDGNKKALEYLHTLIGQPLCYGIKYPDIELYGFGFGQWVETVKYKDEKRQACTHNLHVLCRFKIVKKNGDLRVLRFYEDSSSEQFHSAVAPLIGLQVQRISLSDKNDLWLDLGDYWVVFATWGNGEESWRFFHLTENAPHLVASDRSLDI